MSELAPTAAQQQLQQAYGLAAQQMQAGATSDAIERSLADHGYDAQTARMVVSDLAAAVAEAKRKAGRKNMLYGALWCIGGTAVTAATYQAAATSPGGGHYVVAWGAILFGAIQFFRGLAQSATAG
jgi:hypothetical protein